MPGATVVCTFTDAKIAKAKDQGSIMVSCSKKDGNGVQEVGSQANGFSVYLDLNHNGVREEEKPRRVQVATENITSRTLRRVRTL